MAKRTTYTHFNVKRTSYAEDLYAQDLLENNEFNIDADKYKEAAEENIKKRNSSRKNKLAKSSLFSLVFLLFVFSLITNGYIEAPLINNAIAKTGVQDTFRQTSIKDNELRISNRVRSLLAVATVAPLEQTIPQPNEIIDSQIISLTLTATSVIGGTIPQPVSTATATANPNVPTATWTPDVNNPVPPATDTPVIPTDEPTEVPTSTPTVVVVLPTNTIVQNTATAIITQAPTLTPSPVPLITLTPTPFATIVYVNPTPIGTFVGTDGTYDGLPGLVPAPKSSDSGKFLRADGAWVNIPFNASVTPVILPTAANTVTPQPQPTLVNTVTPITLPNTVTPMSQPTLVDTPTPYTPVATATLGPTVTPLAPELLVTATPFVPVPTSTAIDTPTPLPAELLITATPVTIPPTPVVVGNSIAQNGILTNWGIVTVNSGSGVVIQLPQAYSNNNYSISFAVDGTWGVNGNIEAPVWYSNVSQTSFKISADSQIGGNIEVRWITIGQQ